jgi:hypothetical protein
MTLTRHPYACFLTVSQKRKKLSLIKNNAFRSIKGLTVLDTFLTTVFMIKKERLPIVSFAMFCLLCGLWSGLNRIGWSIAISPITAHHGAIMVGGFLGTLIALEKIIPLKKKALYLIPILNALSVAFFFTNHPRISIYILIISSIALALVFLYYFRKQHKVIYILMLTGALCWLIGNVLLLTKFFYPLAFPWWTAFALFIIAAERLELTIFLPVSKSSKTIFITILFSFIVGVCFSFHGIGNLIGGLALSGIAIWLLRNDMISINLKKRNMPKFVASALLCGYTALLLTGIFYLTLSDQWLNYDAIVHSFFLGFVFSMIFAHGPMILPGIMGISATPFNRILYIWLALLQASWLIRIFSDVTMELDVRKFSGLLSAIAIIGYFVTMAVLTIRSQHAKVY